jgi:tetrahydromethanopterin S-methyltransferase subunit E
VGQVRIHIVKTNNYADLALFHIDLSATLPGSIVNPFTYVFLPSDTTITMPAFGGQTNHIHWKVEDNIQEDSLGGGNLDVDVLHDGVTDVQINY